jgi:hypothetical protein
MNLERDCFVVGLLAMTIIWQEIHGIGYQFRNPNQARRVKREDKEMQ